MLDGGTLLLRWVIIIEPFAVLLKAQYRNFDVNYLYAKVVGGSKWQLHDYKRAEINLIDGTKPSTSDHDRDILGRCIIGTFDSEMSTLSDVRKWDSSTWKKLLGPTFTRCYEKRFSSSSPTGTWLHRFWTWKSSRVKLKCRTLQHGVYHMSRRINRHRSKRYSFLCIYGRTKFLDK